MGRNDIGGGREGVVRGACSAVGGVPRAGGFALVVTLSLMVLLSLVAVGLLGLSAVEMRQSVTAAAVSQARDNARLAMLLAVGELQRSAGADTRVTARADILDEANPPVFGVWKSWEGSDHTQTGAFAGRPVSPGDYQTRKQERFVAWLVSSALAGNAVVPDTRPGADKVALVGKGTVGEGAERERWQVHLPVTPLEAGGRRGAYAWWVAGENAKARVPQPYQAEPETAARWAMHAKSHAVADPAVFGLDAFLDQPLLAEKAVSLRECDLATAARTLPVSRENFHDLSAVATGLLTNTATGGWRKDLSLLTENWTMLGSSNLPFFRVAPGRDLQFTRPAEGNAVPAASMLYPWAAYRGGNTIPIYQHGPVTSWENLKDWATAYKRVSASSSGRITMAPWSVAIDDSGNGFGFLHKVRVLPLIARMQWVFSHWAAPSTSNPASYEARLLVTPVLTMWNPYNVELTASPLVFSVPKPLPAALQYTVNGRANTKYNCLTAGSKNNTPALSTSGSLRSEIKASFTLKPGETRLFSPVAGTPQAANTLLELQPGYRGKTGYWFRVVDDNGAPVSGPSSAAIKANAKFDTIYDDFGSNRVSTGVGIYLDMILPSIDNRRHLVYRMVYGADVANTIYKPLTQMAESTLGACATNPAPFLSTIFGARMASRTHIPAKGFVQSSPLVNYTAMGTKDIEEATISRHYGGTGHPVNSPFDYSFVKHAPGGDSLLPNASDTTGRGYIVTGFNKADGLSRCVIAELPTRPIASLGELQNWDLRYENPIPPYAVHLIGNSDATPLLPPNAVVNRADADLAVNLQYDDSYCANHLLFDDWFVSSIAPDPTAFGTSGKSMQQAYTDFVTGAAPLANRAYLPIAEDAAYAAQSTRNAATLFSEKVRKADSWRMIASRIEVEGMFNVNSTSKAAWRALLGHARRQRVAELKESGGTWSCALSDKLDHPLSRFSVAGDVEARQQGQSGVFPEAAEFAGYRTVEDEWLDKLAEKIVEQVRRRGPFLSLAEFVNRQLSAGDLALAGAVQAALNELQRDSSTNIHATIEALSSRATAVPERAAEAEYKFPEAAAGSSAYGLPGWARQADLLRPLAPVLSARDDTFTVRACGEARDAAGKVLARAVCEAVVRRTRDFMDPADAADSVSSAQRQVNQRFGRRFEVIGFRWLNASEV